jgi:Replication-relaxation
MRGSPRQRLRLAERDLWILEGIAQMRFLTTSQLSKLYFDGARWYVNKRLRNLLDAGLVKVWVRNLAEENIYSITPSGLSAIRHRTSGISEFKIPYGLVENLEHLLNINEVRISLALSLPQLGAEISWWRSDWELRSHGRERIIPDGLFLIKWHGLKEQAYALEVDNNTRSTRTFLKKILAYDGLQARAGKIYGIANAIILVSVADPKWLERYRASVNRLRLGRRIWFARVEQMKCEGASAAVWVNGEEKKYSLREVTFCPYGKDKSAHETLSK